MHARTAIQSLPTASAEGATGSHSEDFQTEASTLELKQYLQRTLRKVATGPSTSQLAKRLEPPPATQYADNLQHASEDIEQPARLKWRSTRNAGAQHTSSEVRCCFIG